MNDDIAATVAIRLPRKKKGSFDNTDVDLEEEFVVAEEMAGRH